MQELCLPFGTKGAASVVSPRLDCGAVKLVGTKGLASTAERLLLPPAPLLKLGTNGCASTLKELDAFPAMLLPQLCPVDRQLLVICQALCSAVHRHTLWSRKVKLVTF